jgi:Fe2+ transport system protein FeoA
MGFTPGCPVRLVARAAFGGPMAFQVRGTLVALRRTDAACIEI